MRPSSDQRSGSGGGHGRRNQRPRRGARLSLGAQGRRPEAEVPLRRGRVHRRYRRGAAAAHMPKAAISSATAATAAPPGEGRKYANKGFRYAWRPTKVARLLRANPSYGRYLAGAGLIGGGAAVGAEGVRHHAKTKAYHRQQPAGVGKAEDWKNITERQAPGPGRTPDQEAGQGSRRGRRPPVAAVGMAAGRKNVAAELRGLRHLPRVSTRVGRELGVQQGLRHAGEGIVGRPAGSLVAGGSGLMAGGGALYGAGALRERHHDKEIARQRRANAVARRRTTASKSDSDTKQKSPILRAPPAVGSPGPLPVRSPGWPARRTVIPVVRGASLRAGAPAGVRPHQHRGQPADQAPGPACRSGRRGPGRGVGDCRAPTARSRSPPRPTGPMTPSAAGSAGSGRRRPVSGSPGPDLAFAGGRGARKSTRLLRALNEGEKTPKRYKIPARYAVSGRDAAMLGGGGASLAGAAGIDRYAQGNRNRRWD